MAEGMNLLLVNFGLVMFDLALAVIIIHKLIVGRRGNLSEITYQWMALIALGFTSIYAFIMHSMFNSISAATIGWQPSPFEYEVAMANLAIGVIAILSFKASYGFRLATVIAATCWLWGDASGHIYQMIKNQNYSPGNAGSWFWIDILLPIILLIAIFNLRKSRR